MDTDAKHRIVTADILNGDVIIVFVDGQTAVYPASVLYELLPQVRDGLGSVTTETSQIVRITPIQVLKGVKLDGYSVAMSELDIILRYVRNAQQYFVSTYRETTGGPRR